VHGAQSAILQLSHADWQPLAVRIWVSFDLDQYARRFSELLGHYEVGRPRTLVTTGFVASWFVTRGVAQFGLVQAAVALILLVFIVAVLAFWPAQWTIWINQLAKKRIKTRRAFPKFESYGMLETAAFRGW
jgi:hypothetical protein